MQTYLKSRPAWIQLLLFLGISSASGILLLGFGGIVLSALTGTPLAKMGEGEATGMPVSNTVLWSIRCLILLQFIGLFILPSIIFARLADPRPAAYLGLRRPWSNSYWLLGTAVLIVALPLVEYTGLLNRQVHFPAALAQKIKLWEESAMRTLMLLLERRDIGNLLANLLFVAVFAGVGEELFFRGVLQRLLIRSLRSPWAGILVTAVLFSFFHFQFYGFVPRFLLGAFLGAAYWYSGSLWVAMVAHTVFDAVQLILAWYHPELATADTVLNASARTLFPAAIASALFTGGVLVFMKRRSATRFEAVYSSELGRGPQTNELSI